MLTGSYVSWIIQVHASATGVLEEMESCARLPRTSDSILPAMSYLLGSTCYAMFYETLHGSPPVATRRTVAGEGTAIFLVSGWRAQSGWRI
jgi:hypothetical protein